MPIRNITYHGRILLIVAEVFVIVLLNYAVVSNFPIGFSRYISLDVLFCLPVIEMAHLTSIRVHRRYNTTTPIIVGISLALLWSATEVAIAWPHFPMIVFWLNTLTRSVIFSVVGRVLITLWREREFARKDMLTGLANRVEFLERLEIEQGQSERSGRPYSVLFIDIDHFKALNDSHGHQVGDDALKMLASILRSSSRQIDVAARLGGDEFVLLLLDTDQQTCEVMIKRIEAASKQAFEAQNWHISVSIGKITKIGKTKDVSFIVHLADENMYQVKKAKQHMLQDAANQLMNVRNRGG
ncbi:MAG: GGDEF domain-containing protein [Gallionella sp.]